MAALLWQLWPAVAAVAHRDPLWPELLVWACLTPSCHCRGDTAGSRACSRTRATKLLEILSALEEEECGPSGEIFISPPDNDSGNFTDENSGCGQPAGRSAAGQRAPCLRGVRGPHGQQ